MAGGKFGGGSGTAVDPFLIEDAHDFNAIRLYSSGYHFQLVKDINLNTPPYNTGAGWIPIPSFSSKIDGQGHKVSGLRIWSKGDDVGLFLSAPFGFYMVNTHFDDFYLEMKTEESGEKIFTLIGAHHTSSSDDPIQGCSFSGKVNVVAPNVNFADSGLLSRRINRNNNYQGARKVSDCLVEVENLGEVSISILGKATGHMYMGSANRVTINLERVVFKPKGKVSLLNKESTIYSVTANNAFIIKETEDNYDNFTTNKVVLTDEKSISKAENVPDFVNASYLGRQTWYFPGSTHVRMVDYSRNKFLLEAGGKIYTCNVEEGLVEVGNAPAITDMFTSYGMDYLESIPINVWNDLKQQYGSVDIHCYVEKIPGKSLVTSKESLSFDQSLDNKVVMRSIINFEDHNNDIFKIHIPTKEQNLEAPEELEVPAEPEIPEEENQEVL